ncbi:hypothetical protein GB928_017845 [Shinella curvata]|uniref:Ti type entry exclusion protein TrbK n=1 Tax=Shinella curvata TaxID=1817964 RepID=A0ABT8XH44_9HYPH|nr:hypothetical protein [Shinella curvata]MCJ8053725.1 hypothetical protein [Shinella curvata]MDO6123057.1 hypothetical protein [Shinella curvata]
MLKIIRYGLIAFAVVFVVFVGVALVALSHINDHIDRCADTSSGKYIFDPDQRQAECSQD